MTLYAKLGAVVEIECEYLLGTCQRQLKASWDRLNNDITVLDAAFLQFSNCPRDQRVYDRFVPSCMHNSNAE